MKSIRLMKALAILPVLGAALLAGCSSHSKSASAPGTTADGERSGAKLWAQNCSRCHNSRGPSEFSNAQWDVVMLHMRVRANLAAKDTAAIREFLLMAD